LDIRQKTLWLKQAARRAGFDYCGVARAEFLEDEAPRLESWLNRGLHGEMLYMERWFDLRVDPCKLLPGAKSVVSLAMNYYPKETLQSSDGLKISRYAYGRDYHKVIHKALKKLIAEMKQFYGEFAYRVFTDSGPVLEKAWAARAGVGWVGKHTNLIIKKAGSYYFLAEIICDLELEYDPPATDHCGTCTRCMDACPTQAIPRPYEVDGSRCISYFTIELKNYIPVEFRGIWDDWIFGCDICQEVCPWNRFSQPHANQNFTPNLQILEKTRVQWLETSEEIFREIAAESPLKRAGLKKIQDNIKALRKTQG
jgi:epoxyqueuosine reductase